MRPVYTMIDYLLFDEYRYRDHVVLPYIPMAIFTPFILS